MALLIPMILILLLSAYFLRTKKSFTIQVNKKWTYISFGLYIGVLLIALIAAEVLSKNTVNPSMEAFSENEFYLVDELIREGNLESVDTSLIIDKRTHAIGNTLSLKWQSNEMNFQSSILIERKTQNDGMIEETLLKPRLMVNELDYSDQMKYTLPKWNDNEVTFTTPPPTKIEVISYGDAFLLNQFSERAPLGNRFQSSTSSQVTVHLLVPKDLIINTDDNLYIEYINE